MKHLTGGPAMLAAALLAASGLLPPALAVVAAASSSYRGQDLWWEGLLIAPLMTTLMLTIVLTMAPLSEPLGETEVGNVYAGDIMRGTALFTAISASVPVLTMTTQATIGGLHGVALVGTAPAWAQQVTAVLIVVGLVQIALAVFLILPAHQLRQRVRPELAGSQLVPFPDVDGALSRDPAGQE